MDDDEENYYQTGMVYVPREEDIKYKDDRGPADLTRVIEEYEQLLKDSDSKMMNKIIKYEKEIKELKDRVNAAETETALIKATGMNSPEMINAKKEITKLKKEICELRQDNRKLAHEVEDKINRMRKSGLI